MGAVDRRQVLFLKYSTSVHELKTFYVLRREKSKIRIQVRGVFHQLNERWRTKGNNEQMGFHTSDESVGGSSGCDVVTSVWPSPCDVTLSILQINQFVKRADFQRPERAFIVGWNYSNKFLLKWVN